MLLMAPAAPASARDLSLDEVLALALVGPAAREADLALESAEAAVIAARGAWDPVLSASGDVSASESRGYLAGTVTSTRGTSGSGSVGLSQSAPTGTTVSVQSGLQRDVLTTSSVLGEDQTQRSWSGSARLVLTQDLLAPLRRDADVVSGRQAREALDQATLTRRATALDLLTDAAEAWWSLWAATDDEALARADLDAAVELEARTLAWLGEGRVARLEVDRATAERLAAERDLAQAASARRQAGDDVLVLIGEPLGDAPEPVGSGRAWTVAVDDRAALVADVLDRDLGLALDRARVDAAAEALRDARDRALPTLTATGSLGVGSSAEDAGHAVTDLVGADGFPTASAGLDLSVPLGGTAARGRTRQAEATLATLRVRLDADRARTEADARAAIDAVTTAEATVRLSEARLEVARATEDGERERVELGASRLDQLLDATHARQAAEVDLRAARVELARAELDLAGLRDRVWEREAEDAG